ncbi:hypothetical protein ACN47E_000082 [Coniothyrium glycines]
MAPRKQQRKEESEESEDPSLHEEEDEDEEMGELDGPPSIDPYEVLEIETEATADDVKKAYRKLALKHHPDKVSEDKKDAANKRFQEIAFAYAVLSDDRRRKRYDLTGSTAETLEDDEDFDWLKFYREQFENIVNEEAINRVANEYKGSAEERKDLLEAYKKYKGSLDRIYGHVMLSNILEDDDRFRQILDEEIEKGTIDSFPKYARETDATRKKAKDAEKKRRDDFDKRQAKENEAGESKGKAKPKSKKKAGGDMSDLAALIQQRQKSRAGNFFDSLEAKYAPKSRGSKRSTPMEEPPEEAFQATAARKKQKNSGRAKKVVEEDEDEDMDLAEEDIGESDDEEVEAPRKPKARAKARGRGRTSSVA